MLDQLQVQVRPEFTTIQEYAVSIFAETGRTVMVTRTGDAPTKGIRFPDRVRNLDIIANVATKDEIDELLKIPEMKARFQILESVPYTDIIIGHEVPTEAQIALAKKQRENLQEGAHIFGEVLFTVTAITVGIAVGILSVCVSALCGKDPIVWARTP